MKKYYLNNKDDKVIKYANVLQFWKENHSKFPNWEKKVKKIFALPATSGAVERFFFKNWIYS